MFIITLYYNWNTVGGFQEISVRHHVFEQVTVTDMCEAIYLLSDVYDTASRK